VGERATLLSPSPTPGGKKVCLRASGGIERRRTALYGVVVAGKDEERLKKKKEGRFQEEQKVPPGWRG